MTVEKEFPKAIEKDLGEGAYKKGLQALKAADRALVKPGNSRLCHGSADIDSNLAAQQPQASRWDYVIAHDQVLNFVEVHPAHTSEVSQVIKKSKPAPQHKRASRPFVSSPCKPMETLNKSPKSAIIRPSSTA
jgi:hypothetical protein